jgi:nicotinamidase-related amidase
MRPEKSKRPNRRQSQLEASLAGFLTQDRLHAYSPMKTVRFTQIVANCGAPSVHLTWVPPEQDRSLKTALKQNRVMTVHQNVRGTTKDYGTVGLLKTPHAQILVFPRSLKRFEERRVVGIDYALLASLQEKDGKSKAASKTETQKSRQPEEVETKSKRARGKAELLSFRTQDVEGDDEAESRAEAPAPALAGHSVEPKTPPTLEEVAEGIAQARKALQKRQVAVARDQLLQLENWIRTSGKLSQEVWVYDRSDDQTSPTIFIIMSALMIVDVQRAFDPPPDFVEKLRRYSRRFSCRVFTRFINPAGSMFRKKLKQKSCAPGTIESELIIAPDKGDLVLEKASYGLTAKHLKELHRRGIRRVTVCGLDTDACVLGVMFSLFDAGIECHLKEDMCWSSTSPRLHKAAVEIIRQQFPSPQ